MENDALDGWVEKYKHYCSYPVVGKVQFVDRAARFAQAILVPVSGHAVNAGVCDALRLPLHLEPVSLISECAVCSSLLIFAFPVYCGCKKSAGISSSYETKLPRVWRGSSCCAAVAVIASHKEQGRDFGAPPPSFLIYIESSRNAYIKLLQLLHCTCQSSGSLGRGAGSLK